MTPAPFTMPKIRPVPIPTKNLGFWASLKVWLLTTRKWELIEDYIIHVPGYGNILVPKGFIFDGASIPKFLRSLVSPTGVLFIPGLIHDYGYQYGMLITIPPGGGLFDRVTWTEDQEFFDNLFRKMAKQINGMNWLDNTAWASLRAFGFIAWNKHRKKEEETA